jgi:type I restriction enzyme, S subunit
MKAVEGWSDKKLSELAEYINGYAFKPDDWGKDGLPIIRIEQLKNPNAPTDYFSGKLPTKNIIENGDLIFSWSASLFLRIWSHGRAALNQHLFRVVEKESVDRDFLKFFIEYYLPELTKASHGSTMQHITRKELDRFCAPFPISKPEQTKIAEILSKVGRAIEQTEALIAKQHRIKVGLMQDLLTRGIDEKGNLRSEETHEFKDSPFGRIPVEWEAKQLSAVVELKVGYAFKSSWFSEDGIRLLRGENVGVGIPDWKDTQYLPFEIAHKFEEYQLNVGDMVIGMDRTFTERGFKVSLLSEGDVPCLLVQRVGCFVPMIIPRGFMQLLIQSPTYQRELLLQQKGMDIPHLSKSEILAPLVPIPADVDEMNTISNIVETLQSNERNTIHNLNKLCSLKTALMQDLLTGKKRVTALLNETEVSV